MTAQACMYGQEQMPNERRPTFQQAKLRNFFLVSFFFIFLPPNNKEG